MKRYAVETAMGCGWENCWTEDGALLTFASRAKARAEIEDLLRDTQNFDSPYRACDYRIVAAP